MQLISIARHWETLGCGARSADVATHYKANRLTGEQSHRLDVSGDPRIRWNAHESLKGKFLVTDAGLSDPGYFPEIA